jgi:hypothetical protein
MLVTEVVCPRELQSWSLTLFIFPSYFVVPPDVPLNPYIARFFEPSIEGIERLVEDPIDLGVSGPRAKKDMVSTR